MRAKKLYDPGIRLGEGPLWDENRSVLTWVDILGKSFYIFNTGTGEVKSILAPQMISFVKYMGEDRYLTALEDGLYLFEAGRFILIKELTGYNGEIRFNDGAFDRKGRFYIGTMGISQNQSLNKEAGKLYLYENGEWRTMISDVTVSNGIAFDYLRKRCYYNDTPTGKVSLFDYDEETGDLSRRRDFVDIPKTEGFPDGMTVDESGNVYVALWKGGGVKIYNPEGDLIGFIGVDEKNVTSVEFGKLFRFPGDCSGEANMERKEQSVLYITTAQNDKGKGGGLYYLPVDQLTKKYSFS